ncbi:PucR family transcriptional regulator [Cryobacterium sp. TMT4-10]|uniref:PucR family transcriptional regulator n=1 Tax=Cryobacterium sp. TMT4-10 TaxID=1259256 RepID=UPI00106BC5C3|nr:PucR family transcriptional regulator [Cryobacterium sp. TMT4-10]TFD12150.1 PucR family transcriptional regulator [Cryobacterium sp. TMT4-10]
MTVGSTLLRTISPYFDLRIVEVTKSISTAFGLELGELVDVPELGLHLVVGSKWALPRVVSWAHATEMTDPRPHLRGSELVCTVGSALLTAANCARLVEAVHATGSAGICLGIGEVHTQIPRALITECHRLSVPLIEMAHGVPFLAINDVLADARVRAQSGSSQRNAELVSRLLAALRENAPVEDILSVSSAALGGSLTYALADPAAESLPMATLSAVVDDAPGSLSVRTAEGNLLAWQGQPPSPDADVLGQIGRVLEIARHERVDHDNQDRQRIGQLFALVSEGLADSAALMPELQRAGLVGKSLTISAWPAETASLLAAHLPGTLIADAPEATFVVTVGPEDVYGAARDLGLVCGHGSPVDVSQISRGIGEARATLRLARRHGKVAGPDSLTSLTGLLEQQPPMRLVPFIDQLVRPLLEHDARRGSQLLTTLRTFIEQQGSLQATAEAQYLHVNTVRHRLGRIGVITGRNPLEDNDRASLAIALWAYDRSRRYVP